MASHGSPPSNGPMLVNHLEPSSDLKRDDVEVAERSTLTLMEDQEGMTFGFMPPFFLCALALVHSTRNLFILIVPISIRIQ